MGSNCSFAVFRTQRIWECVYNFLCTTYWLFCNQRLFICSPNPWNASSSILKIVYKYHHQTPTEYNRLKLFTKNERHPDKYRIPFGRLNTTRFAISFRGPTLWNSLSQTLKSKLTLHILKENSSKTLYKIMNSIFIDTSSYCLRFMLNLYQFTISES